ncbi:MAG TPA: CARDB domain-containing protein, partial [Candidatus Limnocylindrales bacterium]|nr:CARDB domain-containing protein [Candidatus Limnocylindrales bacterium]
IPVGPRESLGPPGANPTRRRRRLGAPLLAVLLALVTAGSLQAESSASIEATVQVAALDVHLALSASSARVGDKIRADAKVTNLGSARLATIVIELRVDTTGLGIKGNGNTTVTKLGPGRSATVSWSICALQPGNYVIQARALVAGVAVDSQARLLAVTGVRRKGCT